MTKNTNMMACGCAVIIEQDGKMVTSVDSLINAIKRLSNRSERRQARSRTATARASLHTSSKKPKARLERRAFCFSTQKQGSLRYLAPYVIRLKYFIHSFHDVLS